MGKSLIGNMNVALTKINETSAATTIDTNGDMNGFVLTNRMSEASTATINKALGTDKTFNLNVASTDSNQISTVTTIDTNESLTGNINGALLTNRISEGTTATINKPRGTDKGVGVGMLSAFNNNGFQRFYRGQGQSLNVGVATVYNTTSNNYNSCTADVGSSLGRIANSSPRNCAVTSGQDANANTAGLSDISLGRICNSSSRDSSFTSGPLARSSTSGVGSRTFSIQSGLANHSQLASRNANSSSRNCTDTSGQGANAYTANFGTMALGSSRDSTLTSGLTAHSSSSGVGLRTFSTSSGLANHIQLASRIGNSSRDSFTSGLTAHASTSSVGSQNFSTPFGQVNHSQIASSINSSDGWLPYETEWLLTRYYEYLNEVGPFKRFKTKKEMWTKISNSMALELDSDRTTEDLSKRVQLLINQKKTAVNSNRTSGRSRVNVPYENLIDKIAAIDDSIEPEVLRDTNSVYYKKNSKKNGEPDKKKPRWDKPNKKAILTTLSETMVSMEQRRDKREKEKEKNRQQMHDELMQILTKGRAN